jgi:hypothetical protein
VSTNNKAPEKRKAELSFHPAADVDSVKKQALAVHADAIRHLRKRIGGDIIETGKRLSECKEIAGHGNWLPWLEREFGWKERTAQRFMQVAQVFGAANPSGQTDLMIPAEALYLLSAPSTPKEVRDSIVERASKGEKIKVAEVKDTISAKKQPAKRAPKQPEQTRTARAAAASQALPGTIGPIPDLPESGPEVLTNDELAACPCPSCSGGPDHTLLTPEAAAEAREAQAVANPLRVRVEELENEIQRLKKETIGLRSQLDDLWDEMKVHLGADADNAPLWSRLHHLLGAAMVACERDANWSALNPYQQQRRMNAIEIMRAAMDELLDLASPAKHPVAP